ncbi:prolyl-tRNA synthetase associated domain-containing protein [Siminovitchia terrae]|uniref:Prolyl-tRNA synthetase associated domain-containing protein n=1 Tax=Siminovitchia terrae TaxID=1914933 RepID=A0A429XAA9_SIMTE|nr:prolyl-tRNA synthetase associated domain-containing protein [Siminovitchia terrae]RST60367.1 prolyl-tRNA synthetase associated domain-containing protein [Siminovitchia terrae]
MNQVEIIDMLNKLQMKYSVVEHPPANTIDEIDSFRLPKADLIVKNLFLRDDKKKNYYLLVISKDKVINLKDLRLLLGSRPLSFASENDLFRYLGLKKGSVTPLGILNDMKRKVEVFIDEELMRFHTIGIHPNENTATLWLSPQDLQSIIEKHGNTVRFLKV